MEKSDEKENENFEDCYEDKINENKQSENSSNKDENKEKDKDKNIENNNETLKVDEDQTINNESEFNNNTSGIKEKKKEKFIPYTMKQAQEKEDESPFGENDKNDNKKEEENVEKVELSEQEKKDIEEKIINERKNAGDLYKNKEYIQALNIYSILLKDAQRADLKEQCCILNCNKGICFNKLNDYDKALDSFKAALRYNKDYSKALCNKMLLLNKKEEYLEAYEDFKRLKTLDYNLWENYRNMENGLAYQAEIQKKKMTDDMLGKLKDVGNTILGKFGLSLNNFQMTPNGQGGYSIQYNNNK